MPGPDTSVADRLRRLRGQAGQSAVPTEPGATASGGSAQPSFADRVRRLMVGPERAPPKEPDEQELAEALGAQRLQPGVLLIERRLESRLRHGRRVLKPQSSNADRLPEVLRPMVAPAFPSEMASAPLLYLDTETSGLSGGSGTWVFLTGMLFPEGDAWRLLQVLLTRLDAEPAYLQRVQAAMGTGAVLVSYNGRAFDAPLLTTRFRICGQDDPLASLPHLDLLAPVRRAFGRVWPDCRLATVESRLLGVERDDDLPGSAAPAAWLDWLRRGETAGLAGVVRHNRWDVLSLAGLVPALGEAFTDPLSAGADTHAVAAHLSAQGRQDEALRILRADRHRLSNAGLLELARLHRRRGDWPEALAIWEALAAAGEGAAALALAKYHEHQTQQLALALEYAATLPPGPDRERRCERLRAKLARRSVA